MTVPSEVVMNIRILKALSDVFPEGPARHFIMASTLRKLKKPNAITGDMLWKFLSTHYSVSEELSIPNSSSNYICFTLDDYLSLQSK
ncbi:hypothetical protein NEPAR06_1552 [Nematocida parisii]|uniref:Uncharacterized protein n=1 Tax=Nematocida parisii (strain ERTm3) TaxID=935791 RepID=I3EH29_NEMP3|nr:uncharacterized protein NEPG_00300 [Nematocida parisii ERTm1]EIJ88526.1 hypothetical protein NEQG_01216 [Nematocida parisii ERTm3]KAI5127767.1 hypothetical protein NEPAR08_1018 [Nematocida parisii]EIJ94776.1 hypothetical protein NEPG_00300 [Nematocida parisii ERTm1]KAI5128203.1 hypothetical protein NEPAR03_1211 [Nematocida parisii]KAI5142382.1 hypothetical protein NEPAR04_1501 [Nematocida parisii]|eukprot:XP_013058132.1 hypothetical protein NEPG_00300 [Nematocida parisii ERTm1]